MSCDRPLVLGYPRSGFTLLISVIANVIASQGVHLPRQRSIKYLCDSIGMEVARRIDDAFVRRGLLSEPIYNFNFRQLAGGPKWLKIDAPETACFRKYIGVKGQGDFTLITSHPRQVLDYYEIIHSHVSPQSWVNHPGYHDFERFASVRHPAGTVGSACFSLNALTSEYIQRFVPEAQDNDLLRQELALYKLSDLNFFEALLTPLKDYADEFMACDSEYSVMRWEDLLIDPVTTIRSVATQLGVSIDATDAAEIWRPMDHVNLTGAHKHNLRKGRGKVEEWKQWLTNTHLDMLRDHGLDRFARRYDYGPIEDLDESAYTPFQKRLTDAIARGEVIREYRDPELFDLAFNKSNLNLDRFDFKRYEWRTHTQIERSNIADEDLVFGIWDAAEEACGHFNQLMTLWIEVSDTAGLTEKLDAIDAMRDHAEPLFKDLGAVSRWHDEFKALVTWDHVTNGRVEDQRTGSDGLGSHPGRDNVLVETIGTTNIVEHREHFFALPQCIGPVDLSSQSPDELPGVLVADRLDVLISRLEFRRPINRLTFFEPNFDAANQVLRELSERDVHSVQVVGDGKVADVVIAAAVQLGVEISRSDIIENGKAESALVFTDTDGATLSRRLLACVDLHDTQILAPVTDWHYSRLPLYLISIPKAGTHLLFELVQALGYEAGIDAPDFPKGKTWYCLDFTNTHTVARDFFVDSVRRAPFGNRYHPFRYSPSLFIYRHPLDILLSEAHYYHRDGKALFDGGFDSLDFEQRVRLLAEDNWLLGSLRERIGGFVPWLQFPNVISFAFEELVGEAGGGSLEVMHKLIWSIQLKLQAPGAPEEIGRQVFNPNAETFRAGRIGGYRDHLPSDLRVSFIAQNADLLAAFGYPIGEEFALPSNFEQRIHRAVGYSEISFDDIPLTVESDFMRCNLVRYRRRMYALPMGAGTISLKKMSEEDRACLPSAPSLVELKALLLLGRNSIDSQLGELAELANALKEGKPLPHAVAGKYWL